MNTLKTLIKSTTLPIINTSEYVYLSRRPWWIGLDRTVNDDCGFEKFDFDNNLVYTTKPMSATLMVMIEVVPVSIGSQQVVAATITLDATEIAMYSESSGVMRVANEKDGVIRVKEFNLESDDKTGVPLNVKFVNINDFLIACLTDGLVKHIPVKYIQSYINA